MERTILSSGRWQIMPSSGVKIESELLYCKKIYKN
jgi:hypothetical protein